MDRENAGKLKIENQELPHSPVYLPSNDILKGPTYSLPNDVTVLTLIERQAVRVPNKTALIFGAQRLSFKALNEKSNRLAAILQEYGVTRNSMVPIVCTNGLELPLAILAIWKAGGAFAPIDPAWPSSRILATLNSLAPPVVLYSCSSDQSFSSSPWYKLDYQLVEGAEQFSGRLPDFQEDLCYGFFTSGSTGTPKCCLNVHRGLLNRFLCMNRRFGDQPDDVILQNSKHVFDSSIWQLIWPLMNGNTVVIPDRNGLLDLDATIDLIAQHQITMADFVPTIFNFMVEMLSVSSQRISKLTSLRRLLIGGEEINPKAVQKFRRLLPEVGITNTYGPTEASIGMVFHDVDDEDKTNISLGRPIDNTFLFISNEELIALPRGEVGEIVIGGECLGRGYLGEHWKTAFSFPPNPYVNLRVNRLYRTGDLGFIDTKGNLQYKGRSDFQVKVDGVRIEIGEIERCLLDFDQVLEAKVVAQKDGSGRVELTALVSLSQPSNESTLKAELQEHLPESSVPKRILILGEMPVNQNGKIDRQKLLEIAGATSMATAGQNVDFENLNEIEAAVLQSMHEVFERTDIDLDDDFFDLGGDSLRAVTLILLLERRLEQEVAVDVIYRYTTAYSLARGLEQNFEETRSSDNGAAALQKDLEESRAKLATLQSFKSSLASPPTQILLTGATGFVGARVLATLLKTSSAHIHCVVRSHSEEAGIKRLRQTLLAYGLPASIQSERISIVSAELTSMRLGLTPTHWSFLSETIDAVVHSAASVDFMKDYLALRNANVIGTRHLLELALEGKPKSFHHISTLSVFNAHEAKDHRIEEKEWTSDCNFPTDGYSLSKLASEGLVEQAQAMGLKATIYRLGEMMPCSEKGVYNPRAFISRLVSASVQCGIYPDIEMTFDYTPVDVTAKVLCWRIFNSFPDNQIYHLFNPAEADFRLLMEELGSLDLSLRRVSYQDFFKVIKHEIQKPDANNELKALFSALPLPSQSRGKETGSPSFSSVVTPAERFDQRQARQLLQAAGLNWPKFDKHLLTAYARQLAEESLRSQEVLSFN